MKDPANDVFPAAIIGMRLARINNLELAGVLGNLPEPVKIGQDQVGTFVARGAARKTDREGFMIKFQSRFLAHHFEQIVFGDQMRRPDLLCRQTQRAPQAVVVLAPGRNITVEELLEWCRSPGPGVNTVGDGLDRCSGEHLPRSFAVLLRDAVHVGA